MRILFKKRIVCFLIAVGLCSAVGAANRALLVREGNCVQIYDVENGVWTEKNFLCKGSTASCSSPVSAVYANGSIFVVDRTSNTSGKIQKFSALDSSYQGVFASLDFKPDGIAVSPDETYLYVAVQSGTHGVWRCSLSGGQGEMFVTDGISTPRSLAFDSAGRLHVAARNNNEIRVYNMNRERVGVMSVPAAKGGVLCDNGRIYATAVDTVYVFSSADFSSVTNYTASMNNTFASANIGGTLYFANYGGPVFQLKNDGLSSSLTGISSICGLAPLPYIPASVHWGFDEKANASCFTNSLSVNFPIYPKCRMQSGASGVNGGCLWLNEKSRGEIKDSSSLIPATGNFSIFFWIGFPASENGSTKERHLFSNVRWQGNRAALMVNLDGRQGKLSWFHDGGEKLWSQTSVQDGAWHHVGIIRRGTRFELWVDGRVETNSVVDADVRISNINNWYIGSSAHEAMGFSGPMAIDDLFVFPADISTNQVDLLFRNATPSAPIPAPPASPAEDLSAADEFGVRIAHENATDCLVGQPAFLVAADGSYYAARDRQLFFHAAEEGTIVYRSTDKGNTWTVCATNTGLTSASLFEQDGNLFLLGLLSVRTSPGAKCFTLLQSGDAGMSWQTRGTSSSKYLPFETAPEPLTVWSNRIWKGCIHTTGNTCALFSFPLSDMSLATATYSEAQPLENNMGSRADLLPGYALPSPSKTGVCILSPSGQTCSSPYQNLPEFAGTFSTTSSTAKPAKNGLLMFPGGSKPFCVRYDETSHLYWAISSAVHPSNEVPGRLSATVCNTLALYSSPDLEEWRFHRDLLHAGTPDTIGFHSPAFDFDGDDLVLVFGLSCADGDTGPRSSTDSNYLMFRRIENFRSISCEKPGDIFLLIPDVFTKTVLRYYPTASGEWYRGSVFAKGSYGGKELSSPISVLSLKNRVYIIGDTKGCASIFEFTLRGKFTRIVATLGDNVRLDNITASSDEKWLYVSDSTAARIYRVNRETGAFDTFIDSGLSLPRVLHARQNGSLLVANRNTGTIQQYSADGIFLENLVSGFAGPQAIWCDDKANKLYYGSSSGPVIVKDLGTGETTTLVNRISAMGMTKIGETFVFSSYASGTVAMPSSDPATPKVIISGIMNAGRPAFINLANLQGFMIIVR